MTPAELQFALAAHRQQIAGQRAELECLRSALDNNHLEIVRLKILYESETRLHNEAADEIERLRAIVDKLPKTADGVPVVPGMDVWLNSCTELLGSKQDRTTTRQAWRVTSVCTGGVITIVLPVTELKAFIYADDCYSTLEAAKAAGEDELHV